MAYISDSKLIHHMDRVLGDQRPITAEIFLTNFCNHRCDYCRFHHGAGFINFEAFKMYVNKCLDLGVKGFILSGGGEPILNPDFNKIMEWLESNGIEYGINTNFSKIKFMKPKYLKVSIDASNPEEYEKFRGVKPEKFYLVRENIINYRKWQREEGHQTTLGIQSLVLDEGHATRFFEAHKDLDVDYMVFRPYEGQLPYYKPDLYKSIRDEIKTLQERDKRVLMNYKWDMIAKTFSSCLSSWSVLTINWNGMVQYCCHKPHEVVGHILDDDILEKKRSFKTEMKTCETPCRLSGSNAFLESLNEGGHQAFV